MSGAMNGVRRSAGKLAVIGVPYVWLLIFFLLPFLIIVKISVSEMGAVSVNDLITYKDGVLSLSPRLGNYATVARDDLYFNTYLSSLKYAAVTTVLCLAIGYPFAHVQVACADCSHHVGHGITGTEGMPVTVALRPEKIRIGREAISAPGDAPPQFNRVRGTIKDMSYFGSYTVYHLQLASGQILKVSTSNAERHREHPLTWGDEAWASWSPTSPVVLTQ